MQANASCRQSQTVPVFGEPTLRSLRFFGFLENLHKIRYFFDNRFLSFVEIEIRYTTFTTPQFPVARNTQYAVCVVA